LNTIESWVAALMLSANAVVDVDRRVRREPGLLARFFGALPHENWQEMVTPKDRWYFVSGQSRRL
jgi:hypothetical protein